MRIWWPGSRSLVVWTFATETRRGKLQPLTHMLKCPARLGCQKKMLTCAVVGIGTRTTFAGSAILSRAAVTGWNLRNFEGIDWEEGQWMVESPRASRIAARSAFASCR